MIVTYTNYEIWMLPLLGEDGVTEMREVIFTCRDESMQRIYVICRSPSGDETPRVISVDVLGDQSDSKHLCCKSCPICDDERRSVIKAFHAGPDESIDYTRDSLPHTTAYDLEVL